VEQFALVPRTEGGFPFSDPGDLCGQSGFTVLLQHLCETLQKELKVLIGFSKQITDLFKGSFHGLDAIQKMWSYSINNPATFLFNARSGGSVLKKTGQTRRKIRFL
jgi:hypothetical protein